MSDNNTDSKQVLPCPWCQNRPQRYLGPADNPHDPCGGTVARVRCVTYQCPLNCFDMSPQDWNRRASVAAPGEAEKEFLAASVAVWREIDRLSAMPEGYKGLPPETDPRKRELAAWEKYRTVLDSAAASSPTPAELPPCVNHCEHDKKYMTGDPAHVNERRVWCTHEDADGFCGHICEPLQPEGEQE